MSVSRERVRISMKEIWLAIIPATVPTLAVLVGILLNQNGINRRDGCIDRIEWRIDRLEANVDTRIGALGKQLHDAILMLVNISNELDKRLIRLEDKS